MKAGKQRLKGEPADWAGGINGALIAPLTRHLDRPIQACQTLQEPACATKTTFTSRSTIIFSITNFYGDDVEHEADAQGAEDELEEDETPGDFDDLDEERLEHPAWFDDCDE